MAREVRIVNKVEIGLPADEVFRRAATPATWPEWHPTALSVSGDIDRPVEAGDEIVEQDRFSFLRGSIEWQVREAAPGRGWIIDGVVSGVPLAAGARTTVQYVLSEIEAGTRVERTMTYRAPSLRAHVLDLVYLRRHNAVQSERAIQGMKRLLEQS